MVNINTLIGEHVQNDVVAARTRAVIQVGDVIDKLCKEDYCREHFDPKIGCIVVKVMVDMGTINDDYLIRTIEAMAIGQGITAFITALPFNGDPRLEIVITVPVIDASMS